MKGEITVALKHTHRHSYNRSNYWTSKKKTKPKKKPKLCKYFMSSFFNYSWKIFLPDLS